MERQFSGALFLKIRMGAGEVKLDNAIAFRKDSAPHDLPAGVGNENEVELSRFEVSELEEIIFREEVELGGIQFLHRRDVNGVKLVDSLPLRIDERGTAGVRELVNPASIVRIGGFPKFIQWECQIGTHRPAMHDQVSEF